MEKQDYYKTLSVSKNASAAELKKAYRRLAMKYHPDRNPNDKSAEEKFKEAKEAFEVLNDPQKRSAYDQFGHSGVNQSSGGHPGGGSGDFSDIFGDVFGDIFGGAGGQQQRAGPRPSRGSDLQYNLQVSLEDAVFGATRKIKIPSHISCGVCKGTGAKKGTSPVTCSMCSGAGQVRMQQGFFSVQQTCPTCKGTGQEIKDKCPSCYGKGKKEETKTLSVKVPAGVDTGDRIRLSGEGEVGGLGGPSGDLFVQMVVKDHAIFKREGAHLLCQVPINIVKAGLGGEVEVPTLNGKVKLKMPAGTQSEKVFRIRGKGVKPVRGGQVGDILCKVMVETPVNLTSKQKNILKAFGATIGESSKHSPQEFSWLNGVKKFVDDMNIKFK